MFGRVAVCGTFNCGEDCGQIGVEAFIGVGSGGNIFKKLAWVDEVTFCFYGIVFDFFGDYRIGKFSVIDAFIIGLDVVGKVFTDEPVKERA